jgi:hypothetical protein
MRIPLNRRLAGLRPVLCGLVIITALLLKAGSTGSPSPTVREQPVREGPETPTPHAGAAEQKLIDEMLRLTDEDRGARRLTVPAPAPPTLLPPGPTDGRGLALKLFSPMSGWRIYIDGRRIALAAGGHAAVKDAGVIVVRESWAGGHKDTWVYWPERVGPVYVLDVEGQLATLVACGGGSSLQLNVLTLELFTPDGVPIAAGRMDDWKFGDEYRSLDPYPCP